MIEEGSRSTVCDPSFIALPMLAVLGAAIGNSRRVQIKSNWREPSIIWTAIIGESGTSKTPAFSLVTEPLRQLQDEAYAEYDKAIEQYKAEVAIFDVEYTAWKKAATKSKANAGDPPVAPRMPRPKRYRLEDATTEALAPILQANPRGVLLARDELSGWFASFDRHSKNGVSGGDAANWLQCFNGNSMSIDRKTGIPPTIYVSRASVSLTGGIQPAVLKRMLTAEHRESGLAARFVFAAPPPFQKFSTETEMSQELLDSYADLIRTLHSLEMIPDPRDMSEEPRLIPQNVHLSPEAKRIWVDYYNLHGAEQVRLQSDLAAAWSKLEGYTPRFALIIHMVRWATGDADAEGPLRHRRGQHGHGHPARQVVQARGVAALREARRDGPRAGRPDAPRLDRAPRRQHHGARADPWRALVPRQCRAGGRGPREAGAGRAAGGHPRRQPSRKGGRPRFEYRIARVAETPLRGHGSGGSGTGDSGDTDSNANPEDDWGSL